MSAVDADLADAFQLADIADSISGSHFRRSDLRVNVKADGSVVSTADLEIELALRKHVAAIKQNDCVIGEEFGAVVSGARRWIIDPIDGSKAYVRGNAIFATLIALEAQGIVQLGVVSAPALKHRWWAVRGKGAFADGWPIRVSLTPRLADAHVALAESSGWVTPGQLRARSVIAHTSKDTETYDNFLSHMLVAEGLIDAALEPSAALWDLAAVQVIVTEAGGCFTDIAGNHTAAGGSGLASNGLIHDELIRILQSAACV